MPIIYNAASSHVALDNLVNNYHFIYLKGFALVLRTTSNKEVYRTLKQGT